LRSGATAAYFIPVLLLGAGVWLVAALATVRAGDLGTLRGGDPVVEGDAFPKVLVDPSGRRMTLQTPPRRVVSLMLGADEILTALLNGVDPERLVGVSRFADNPALSTCAERVPAGAARLNGVDPERILALEPEVIFAAGYTLDSAVRILAGAGIAVVRFGNYRSYADVEANIRIVGAVLGVEPRAAAMIESMRSELDAIGAQVAGRAAPRVLYYSQGGYTSGSGTLVDEKIRRAGGINVLGEVGIEGPKHLPVDLLVALDPEVVIIPRWLPDDDPAALLLSDPLWAEVQAVRGGRVAVLDARTLTSVSQDGVKGVRELAKVLHPGAFES
jgi:iron complex transport system substrate-binding protein